MAEDLVFALDIGTRSVVGVVLVKTEKGLEISASEQLEHQTRAMVDGQIHDVEQVASAIKTIKERIEAKTGLSLTQVAVAAAGRALRTVRMRAETEIEDFREIHRDDILRLELEAVQKAQGRLFEGEAQAEDTANYHCVGYSVVVYDLDGYKIGNLYGQKGKTMGVEVIATFLPRLVVDSLLSSMERAGLKMMSLTLEPIAASAVVVPSSMRQLNIALVDIGAGTSDIAITDGGAIIGYGMVPVAGDEVTEKIVQHCLLDFNEAEVLKRSLNNTQEITYKDILGVEHLVSKEEILEEISDTIDHLAQSIGEKIVEINGRMPQAVICIGGGSLTPLLKDKLADYLGLSKQRVAVRGREAITEVLGAQELIGPEAVTPIGIAVTAYEHQGLGFARVTVNSREVRLFEIHRGTVADALLAAGISISKTKPRLGLALTVTVNGELKILKGSKGRPAEIKLNGHDVNIDTPVKHNDVIDFREASDGSNGKGAIYDVVPEMLPINVIVNNKQVVINPVITMNNQPASLYDELVDNAKIVYYLPRTLAEVLEISGFADAEGEYQVYVNERIVDPMSEINDGDEIVLENISSHSLPVIESPEETYVQAEFETACSGDNDAKSKTTVQVNEEKIEIPRNDIILTDILTRVNFPLNPPGVNSKLVMKVNGMPAEFTTPLKSGDNVTLEWN